MKEPWGWDNWRMHHAGWGSSLCSYGFYSILFFSWSDNVSATSDGCLGENELRKETVHTLTSFWKILWSLHSLGSICSLLGLTFHLICYGCFSVLLKMLLSPFPLWLYWQELYIKHSWILHLFGKPHLRLLWCFIPVSFSWSLFTWLEDRREGL